MHKKTIQRGIFILSMATLCVLVVSSLLGFLGDKSIVLDFFAHPRLQYAWGALVLAVIFGIFKKWKLVAVAVVAMIFNTVFMANFHSTERSEGEHDLRLMSANIFYFNTDYDRIVDSIHEANPDVVTLIEISDESFAEISERLPEYDRAIFSPSPATFGIATFAKEGVEAELDAKYLSSLESGTTVTKVHKDGKTLTVLGVHTVAPTGIASPLNDRVLEIASLADYAQNETNPLVIMGDYNDTTFSPTMKPFWDAGLRDSRTRFELDLSWPLFFPSPLQITIDHALIKNGVKVIDRKLGKSTGGDHAPLILDIAL